MNLLLASALAFACAAPAAAATYESDPRVELLGVLQYLSGERPKDLPADEAYRAAVEKAFGAFRTHPAVNRWRDVARLAKRMDGRAIDLLYFTDPPELAPKAGPKPPYLDDPETAARFGQFLAALRDFARRTAFMDFYASRKSDYARVVAASAGELGVKDPLRAVQDYVGLTLDSRARWVVSPLFVPSGRNAYITPYPDPQTLPDPGPGEFQVTTLLAYVPGQGPAGDVVTQRHRTALWQEPLFVFIDPALAAFDAERPPSSPAAFYGDVVAECRASGGPDCAKNWIIAALSARLDVQAFGTPSNGPDGRDPRRDAFMAALSERLLEYEKDRKRWKNLWSFMPRLMAVFPEQAAIPVAPFELRQVGDVKDLFPARQAAPAK